MDSDACAVLSIDADVAEIRRASVWVGKTGLQMGVPPEQIERLDLCLNEALANVLEHGGQGARQAPIVLTLGLDRDAESRLACLTVSDAGHPVNPLLIVPKNVAHTLEDATPGGLGIQMIRTFSDRLEYHFSQGRNHLTFAVRWADQEFPATLG
ncbi:MAG: hypothetical protein RL758_1912 [Pseudomonadota bacterium]|jgi:serine/threonine-protein kinase RsbW